MNLACVYILQSSLFFHKDIALLRADKSLSYTCQLLQHQVSPLCHLRLDQVTSCLPRDERCGTRQHLDTLFSVHTVESFDPLQHEKVPHSSCLCEDICIKAGSLSAGQLLEAQKDLPGDSTPVCLRHTVYLNE